MLRLRPDVYTRMVGHCFDELPNEARLVGVFGFIGRYKGFDTVIRALHHLPHDYHLLIFGGIHPNEIKPHQPIDPVVSSLFDAGYVDTNVAERIRADPAPGSRRSRSRSTARCAIC